MNEISERDLAIEYSKILVDRYVACYNDDESISNYLEVLANICKLLAKHMLKTDAPAQKEWKWHSFYEKMPTKGQLIKLMDPGSVRVLIFCRAVDGKSGIEVFDPILMNMQIITVI